MKDLFTSSSTGRDNAGEPKEISIRDIDKAEFGTAPSAHSPSVTHHRLEFIMRDGRRMPATNGPYDINEADRTRLLEALNQELSLRRALL